MKLPRLFGWLLIAAVLLMVVAILAPQNLPVIAHKLTLLTLAGVVGYWFDRSLFPYARPHRFHPVDEPDLGRSDMDYGWELVFAAAMLRRAVIILAFVIGAAVAM